MKNLKLLFLLFLTIFTIRKDVFAQTVGDPYANDCFAGVQRILARAVNADFMSEEIGNNSAIDAQIAMFVQLRASMLVRCIGTWEAEERFLPNFGYLNGAADIVTRINTAFDVAQLRRPVIQAGIFESVSDHINQIEIPTDILNMFMEDIYTIDPSNMSDYFTGTYPNVTPRSGVHYTLGRVRGNSMNPQLNHNYTAPDGVSSAEGRMWIFHQAKAYIDRGVTGLHLGQVDYWGQIRPLYPPSSNLSSLQRNRIVSLVQRMRSYANNLGKLLLISLEGSAIDYNDSNGNMIFDFSSSPLRPVGVTYSEFTACNGLKNAITGVYSPHNSPSLMGGTGSGISPLGCYYSTVPYTTYFDFGSGRAEDCVLTNPNNTSGSEFVWGYDDARWFGKELNNDICRGEWLKKYMCELRNPDNTMGFLQAPGRLVVKSATQYCGEPYGDTYFKLDEHPDVLSAINTLWIAKEATIGIEQIPCEYSSGIYPQYGLEAGNYDCTSVYSWHIQRPNGSWEPFTYGPNRTFEPHTSGTYTVYLRQDNLGLPTNTYPYGTRQISTTIYVNATKCNYYYSANQGGIGKNDFPVIYPNPTTEEISINYSIKKPGNVSISVFNATGSKIMTLKDEQNEDYLGSKNEKFNVSNLAPGVYIVAININNDIQKIKLIKL